MIEGLGSICLEVSNLPRAVAFYRDGLRFVPVTMEDGPTPRAVLKAGAVRVVLTCTEPSGHRLRRRGTGIVLMVDVTGVDAYHDALVARGLAPTAPVDDPEGRHFTLVDPDGYHWRFRQAET